MGRGAVATAGLGAFRTGHRAANSSTAELAAFGITRSGFLTLFNRRLHWKWKFQGADFEAVCGEKKYFAVLNHRKYLGMFSMDGQRVFHRRGMFIQP
jgi:hypothetical protein